MITLTKRRLKTKPETQPTFARADLKGIGLADDPCPFGEHWIPAKMELWGNSCHRCHKTWQFVNGQLVATWSLRGEGS